MRSPFSIKWIYLIKRRSFSQKYKFSDKNGMVSAWRNFKNIFSGPLFTIIFRPERLKFHPYSRVEFVIHRVLMKKLKFEKNLAQLLFNFSTDQHFRVGFYGFVNHIFSKMFGHFSYWPVNNIFCFASRWRLDLCLLLAPKVWPKLFWAAYNGFFARNPSVVNSLM